MTVLWVRMLLTATCRLHASVGALIVAMAIMKAAL